jgi:SNF2 family DNA or RNA helicase
VEDVPVRKETYGEIVYSLDVEQHGLWKVTCRPQVAIKLKNYFKRAYHGEAGSILLRSTDEVCRDLLWWMDRFPMDVSEEHLKLLRAGGRRHHDTVLTIEEMIDPKYKPRKFKLKVPPRVYQRQGADIFIRMKSLLCADELGLGKTITAITAFADPRTLPAVVVTPAGIMPNHWDEKLKQFLPEASVHIVQTLKPYELPKFFGKGPDIVICTYHKLAHWRAILAAYARTVVFDECQELRRVESNKWSACKEIADGAKFRLGLSATPIYNFGDEIWNIMQVLAPDRLGDRDEFLREWGDGSFIVKDPKALGMYLREQGMMIRRTRKDVGRELPPITRVTETVEIEDEPLQAVATEAEALAKIILSNVEMDRGEQMRAAGELDWKLREATGAGKAPHVADFVRLLVENGEPVVVFGWHHAFYAIMKERLKDLLPATFTGEDSPAHKLEARRRFMEGETKVLLISLRAGIGIDGFQDVCRTVVFGELDWSPGVHEQCIGRVARDGQKDPTTVYFLVAREGSDPVVSEKLGLKRAQVEGIRNPTGEALENLQAAQGKAKSLARHFLQKLGKYTPEMEEAEEDDDEEDVQATVEVVSVAGRKEPSNA